MRVAKLKNASRVNTLGALIRDLREQQGLTQEHLARTCGMTQTQLSRIEAGHVRKFDPILLKRIAKVLRVTVGHLIGETLRDGPQGLIRVDPAAQRVLHGYARLLGPRRKEFEAFLHFLEEQQKHERNSH